MISGAVQWHRGVLQHRSRRSSGSRSWLPAIVEIAAFDRPPVLAVAGLYVILVFIVPYATPAPEGAPGMPGSFLDKVRLTIERVQTALFGGVRRNAQ